MARAWSSNRYGRLTGGQVRSCLELFKEMWSLRTTWEELNSSDEKYVEALQRLMAVPNWLPFYDDSLVELLAKIVVVAGVGNVVIDAVESEDPAGALIAAANCFPEEAPDHPGALPLAFAMIGNLDAIAHYSRSINDMIAACRDTGELQPLFDAISVDSAISTMPFFQAAMRLGQLSGDTSVANYMVKALKGPHKKRLDYPVLRWAEYLLRDQGAFETCSREDIYELVVVHLGIYDPAGAKKDPKAALFTLFRAWQKGAGIQNPRFGFSGNGK